MKYNSFSDFRKGGDFLNLMEQNDLLNKLHSFTFES